MAKRKINRLRNEKGQFVSKLFQDKVERAFAARKGVSNFEGTGKNRKEKTIEQVRGEANISYKDLKLFYNQNEDIFLEMLHTGFVHSHARNSNQIEKDISNFKGKIILNGEAVNKAEAKLALVQYRQILASEINAQDFTLKYDLTFENGELRLNIPDANKIVSELMEYLGIKDLDELDEFSSAEINEALSDILNSEYGEGEVIIYAS